MSSRKNLNKLNKNLNQEDLTLIYYKENRWEKKRKSKERDIKKLSFSKNVNPVKDIYKIYNSDNLKNKSNPNTYITPRVGRLKIPPICTAYCLRGGKIIEPKICARINLYKKPSIMY